MRIASGLFVVSLFLNCSLAWSLESATELLKKADDIKTLDYVEFAKITGDLHARSQELSKYEQEYLQYLTGWQRAYEGEYNSAVSVLNNVSKQSADSTLRLRARSTLINMLSIAKRYEEAFSQLTELLDLLPQVTDKGARAQGLAVAALLYIQVGERELGEMFVTELASENTSGRNACIASELRLRPEMSRGRELRDAEYQRGVDSCVETQEKVFANIIRGYQAQMWIERGRYEDAIDLVKRNYTEILQTKYVPLIAQHEVLLAQAYNQLGDIGLARQFALRSTESAVRKEYTEPLVNAYRLLYKIAKKESHVRAALLYHEKYAIADKGYLDDVSARQLAYQRISHETLANKLQIDALNKQNKVLKLQQALADKAVETSRLYIVMLVMGLVFVVFMAYRTKRSQMHFKGISRLDGLTGLSNRPHFMDLAERALEDSQKSGQPLCVIICDLDYFKRINDTFGHAAGDSALKQTATVFQAYLRKQDIVGRLGGEEFSMVLIDCDAATAQLRCDEIRLAIAKISIGDSKAAFILSASFGIAVTDASKHELRKLLADADAALYQAKLSGRNRVVQHSAGFASETPQSSIEPLSA